MADLLPDREQARKLVVSIAVFWAAWAVAVASIRDVPVLSAIGGVVGVVFLFYFYLTLYRVWEPESGVSAWRMMFMSSFSRRQRRTALHLFDLLRPRWIGHTLRETGWNPRVVGGGLLALLVTDLVLY